MIDFDVFQMIASTWPNVEIHNVRLLDVTPGPDNHERLTIEHAGATRTIDGGGRWSEDFSRHSVGQVGHLVVAASSGHEAPSGAMHFREYVDQSLRRVPELDDLRPHLDNDGTAPLVVGWRCDAKPHGFRAPAGLIPGQNGQFVPDESVAVTLRVPKEFVRECRAVRRTPAEVLKGFVGDLAGTANYLNNPRADGYCSNGSDERMFAETWLERAYGMDRVDLDALDAEAEEQQEAEYLRDELASYVDEFVDAGGSSHAVLAVLDAMVTTQRETAGDAAHATPGNPVYFYRRRQAIARPWIEVDAEDFARLSAPGESSTMEFRILYRNPPANGGDHE